MPKADQRPLERVPRDPSQDHRNEQRRSRNRKIDCGRDAGRLPQHGVMQKPGNGLVQQVNAVGVGAPGYKERLTEHPLQDAVGVCREQHNQQRARNPDQQVPHRIHSDRANPLA